jgi:uncharacterized protein (TIGR03083 family)
MTGLWQLEERDVRPMLTREREDLLELLGGLTDEEWSAPSAVAGWRVKDLALHLLDDDLGWLSRGRDGDASGLLDSSESSFVAALAAKNQRWIDGAQGLSRHVVTDLLRWSGGEMDRYYAGMNLSDLGSVAWASDASVPLWFDLAQDLTERWVHQQQIRVSLDRDDGYRDRYLAEVLRTSVWAAPHQYRVLAEQGVEVIVRLGGTGVWTLVSDGRGQWSLHERTAAKPSAAVSLTDDGAWRLFTGARLAHGDVRAEGDSRLAEPLLQVRGILV